MTTNSVLLEINTQSIVQLVKTLDLLKENSISFNLIEEPPKIINEPKNMETINNTEKRSSKYLLGKNGLKILGLLSEGYTYSEIAEKAGITIDGVRYYVKKIFNALKVNNGRDAVRIYLTEMK